MIRVAESSLTAIVYFYLGLFVSESTSLLVAIVPCVLIGIPLGAFAIRRLDAETFRRICMSFDAWIVGFGLSRVLIELALVPGAVSAVEIPHFSRGVTGSPRRTKRQSGRGSGSPAASGFVRRAILPSAR